MPVTKETLLDTRSRLDADQQKRYDEVMARIDGGKSLSQKLRFALFEQFNCNHPTDDFENYYADQMNMYINGIVARLAMHSNLAA